MKKKLFDEPEDYEMKKSFEAEMWYMWISWFAFGFFLGLIICNI